MKKTITTLVFLFVLQITFAQDVIVKNDKTEIKAKIEELTETAIKYKKFEMLDGPTYNTPLAPISESVAQRYRVFKRFLDQGSLCFKRRLLFEMAKMLTISPIFAWTNPSPIF